MAKGGICRRQISCSQASDSVLSGGAVDSSSRLSTPELRGAVDDKANACLRLSLACLDASGR